MNSHFRHVALIGKYHALGSRSALEDIAQFLHRQGCEVSLETETANNTGLLGYPALSVSQIGAQCDLGLVVGGDGTMLGIGRQLAQHGVPLIGINQGRLGFITDIPFEGFQATLGPMLHGMYEAEARTMMQARVMRDGHCVFTATALNDVVVNRGATAGMVELRVEVDGRFVANQRADGLIIATPTGSTGYAMAAGGPILHPSIDAIVVNPICPMSLSSRPVVVPPRSVLAIWPLGESNRRVKLWKDGALASVLEPGDRCVIRQADHHALLVSLDQQPSYFSNLSHKLHWAGSLSDAMPSQN